MVRQLKWLNLRCPECHAALTCTPSPFWSLSAVSTPGAGSPVSARRRAKDPVQSCPEGADSGGLSEGSGPAPWVDGHGLFDRNPVEIHGADHGHCRLLTRKIARLRSCWRAPMVFLSGHEGMI